MCGGLRGRAGHLLSDSREELQFFIPHIDFMLELGDCVFTGSALSSQLIDLRLVRLFLETLVDQLADKELLLLRQLLVSDVLGFLEAELLLNKLLRALDLIQELLVDVLNTKVKMFLLFEFLVLLVNALGDVLNGSISRLHNRLLRRDVRFQALVILSQLIDVVLEDFLIFFVFTFLRVILVHLLRLGLDLLLGVDDLGDDRV